MSFPLSPTPQTKTKPAPAPNSPYTHAKLPWFWQVRIWGNFHLSPSELLPLNFNTTCLDRNWYAGRKINLNSCTRKICIHSISRWGLWFVWQDFIRCQLLYFWPLLFKLRSDNHLLFLVSITKKLTISYNIKWSTVKRVKTPSEKYFKKSWKIIPTLVCNVRNYYKYVHYEDYW